MESKEKVPTALKDILEIRQDLFERMASDAYEMYKKGRFRMVFYGPVFHMAIPKEDEEILVEKYKVSNKQLAKFLRSYLFCIHHVLTNEVNVVSEMLSENDAKNFRKKINVVTGIIEKDSTIRNSYYIYSLSKIPFFSGVNWEAEIKVFYSPQEYLTKPPKLPVGRIQIQVEDPAKMPPESTAIEFEIGLKDVENMIKSLEDLRKALSNLENAKIVHGKAE
jgi:hypothetical protein